MKKTFLIYLISFYLLCSFCASACAEDYMYCLSDDGNSMVVTGCGDAGDVLDIPSILNGKPVTGIDAFAFMGAPVSEVILPEGIVTIDACAFLSCTGLRNVQLPGTLKTIGDMAFCETRLTRLELPAGMETIGESAFEKCAALETVTVPGSVLNIAENAFAGCALVNLVVEENSYAHQYAVRKGISYRFPTASVTAVNIGEIAAPQEASDPYTLPELMEVSVKKGTSVNLYTMPDEKSTVLLSKVKTGETLMVYGRVGDFLLISHKNNKNKVYVGYVAESKLRELNDTGISTLALANRYAGVCRNTTGYTGPSEDSVNSKKKLNYGAELNYLGTVGDWAYVETRTEKKPSRFFVKRKDIIVSKNTKIPVMNAVANNSVEPSRVGTYYAAQAVDGEPSTAWQFEVPKSLDSVHIEFAFSGSESMDYMVIRNGFWKVTNGHDQYTANGVITEMEIRFLYAGHSDYTDFMRVTLPETKDWKTRADGIYIDLSGHDDVIGVCLVPYRIRKGKRFKTDVAISEVAFFAK